MRHFCLSCQTVGADHQHGYHAECAIKLFGTESPPIVRFSTPEIVNEAQKMVGKMSVSGVQPKLSVAYDRKTGQLIVVEKGGEYILKPQTERFPMLPENENLCMRIASHCGTDIPAHGLIPLADERFAYLVKRFDRTDEGFEFQQEDFQQLLESDDKYDGSYERMAKIIRKHSCNPEADLFKLYERAILFFVLGNGDAHLKNFSLIRNRNSGYQLSPAYDIVSSRLAMSEEREEMCLSIQGKRNRISRRDFIRLSQHFGLNEEQSSQVSDRLKACQPEIEGMIKESFLSEQSKNRFLEIFKERMKRIHI
jgi:serine/threonine-protein kinase HipA